MIVRISAKDVWVSFGWFVRFLQLMLWCASVVLAQTSAAQTGVAGEPPANPGRPTISTPATLTPIGYVQLETGGLAAFTSPEFHSQSTLADVLKVTVLPRWQLLLAFQPISRSIAAGNVLRDTGDVSLGAQGVLVFGEGAKPTISVSYYHRFYAGDSPNGDVGSQASSAALLGSANVKGFHYDANTFFNEVVDGSRRRLQFGQSIAISHPLSSHLVLSGEIWNFRQPFLHRYAVGNLWAVSYAARPRLIFDAGFNHGLTATSTRWQVFGGVTYLFAQKLWHK